MRKAVKVFAFIFLTIWTFYCIPQAEDMNVIMDKFYNDLADIVERNMNNPEMCVVEVDNYYRSNQVTVEKMRKMTGKFMNQAMSEMNKYQSMSEEELEALERKAGRQRERMEQQAEKRMIPGAKRYAKAIEVFSMKHPQQAMKISLMALQFLPRANVRQR